MRCVRCGGRLFGETVMDNTYRKYHILQCVQCGHEEELGRDSEAAKEDYQHMAKRGHHRNPTTHGIRL